jgi:hypothetical protein
MGGPVVRVFSPLSFNSQEKNMKKWEYLPISRHLWGKDMNNLGEQGWELISYAFTDGGPFGEDVHRYIFKREKK